MLVPDTAVASLSAVAAIEHEIHRPTVGANHATLRYSMVLTKSFRTYPRCRIPVWRSAPTVDIKAVAQSSDIEPMYITPRAVAGWVESVVSPREGIDET